MDKAAVLAYARDGIKAIDFKTQPNHRDTERPRQRLQAAQDGKRTLIKNQLYLIEQLQLENANLRNERDQLQLENEELKFQLQMIRVAKLNDHANPLTSNYDKFFPLDISSSNIFNQSGTSFNDDRQLERLVESDSANGAAVIDELPVRSRASSRPTSCLLSQTTNNSHSTPSVNQQQQRQHGNHHYDHQTVTSSSGLARLTATPLRHPAKLPNELQAHIADSRCKKANCQHLGEATSEFDASLYAKTQPSAASPAKNAHLGGRLSVAKSTSFSAFNVKAADRVPDSPLIRRSEDFATIDQDEQEDEQKRVKLVQQLYGDEEKVHAAAVTIQRAFRKHQICRRFRMITEQLRYASKSSPTHLRKGRQDQPPSQQHQQHQQRVAQNNDDKGQVQVPFASGATRAAAWESLSLAASRLAASAASATASTKQVFSNGVSKSVSCQQVGQPATRGQLSQSKPPLSATSGNDRSKQFKTNSAVAAAINFQQLESIRKRQYRVGLNVFNKHPEKGISFLIAHSFIDCSPPYTKTSHSYYLSNQLHFIDKQQLTAQQHSISPNKIVGASDSRLDPNCRLCREEENLKCNIAHFLLHRKGLAKERIGQYLGNLQCKFNQDVLKYYLQELNFNGLQIDVALRKFSATMRMPGEAQKIERFVDCFAQRYVQCQQAQQIANDFSNPAQPIRLPANHGVVRVGTEWADTPDARVTRNPAQTQGAKNNLTLLTKDEIFILTFAIIMLNTDLHSPSLKSTSRMSASQFVNNLRGVFKSQSINEADLIEIYERVKANQITTEPDHVSHVMKVQQGLTNANFQKKELPNLCVPHRRLVCFCRLFEVHDVNKKERIGQHQREIFLFNDLLLVTKLSRRPRANTPQQYTYRQSIALQGLYVQLFQSVHYNFGIRLCRRSNDETLIMFNARNELDQSRFVDDLNESIAEMDEMEAIRSSNLIDSIHSKHQERLRRHALLHDTDQSLRSSSGCGSCAESIGTLDSSKSKTSKATTNHDDQAAREAEVNHEASTASSDSGPNVTVVVANGVRRLSAKFSSMSNLASVAEIREEKEPGAASGSQVSSLRQNRSFVQRSNQLLSHQLRQRNGMTREGKSQLATGPHRSSSINSVHSLDSGLFLSRDVSPNQSG